MIGGQFFRNENSWQSKVESDKRNQFSYGWGGAHWRSLEALGFFVVKYAFFHILVEHQKLRKIIDWLQLF